VIFGTNKDENVLYAVSDPCQEGSTDISDWEHSQSHTLKPQRKAENFMN
jgi:hypothetical protein